MDTAGDLALLHTLLIGICGMFVMAIAIILFFLVYQKRLLRQQKLQIEINNEHQKELLRASLKSQETERQRIAKDLHDDVGALLSTSRLYLEQLKENLQTNDQTKLSEKVIELHAETIVAVRNIAQDLRPIVLETLGLHMAVFGLITRLHKVSTLQVAFDMASDHVRLDKNGQLELYRILQELLNNTLKHAYARHALIKLTNDQGWVHLRYQDDGIGFDWKKVAQNKGGLGLKNIESRVNVLNGKIDMETKDPGTHILIKVPAQP